MYACKAGGIAAECGLENLEMQDCYVNVDVLTTSDTGRAGAAPVLNSWLGNLTFKNSYIKGTAKKIDDYEELVVKNFCSSWNGSSKNDTRNIVYVTDEGYRVETVGIPEITSYKEYTKEEYSMEELFKDVAGFDTGKWDIVADSLPTLKLPESMNNSELDNWQPVVRDIPYSVYEKKGLIPQYQPTVQPSSSPQALMSKSVKFTKKSNRTVKKGKSVLATNMYKFSDKTKVSKIVYSTSNKKVATVNSKGKIKAKKKGKAKIYMAVTFKDNSKKKYSFEIKVK